jgi:O-antigen ligase
MTRLLVDKRSIDLFILGILLGAMFLAVWGCQQYVLGNYRLEGVGGRRFGSNEFGAIMVSVLPLFVYKAKGVMPFFKEKQKQVLERIFFGVGSLSVFWAIIFTFSRGAFLGLCAAFALTWWRSANRARYLVVFVVLGMLLMPALPQNYRQRIDSIFSAKDSIVEASDLDDLNTMVSDGAITGRLAFWGAALEMTKDHPIFGVGLQNFELLTRTYLPEIGKNKDTHNTYLKVMAELGIVGITLFLGMVFGAIREIHLGRRLSLSAGNDRFLGYFGAVEAGLFGLLISGFTSSYNYTEPLYWLMFLGASLRNVAVGKPVSPIGEEFAIGLDRGAPYGLEEAS